MTEDCEKLKEALHFHEGKSRNLFKEAEELHQKALQIPYTKRIEVMNQALAKQKEAIKEIHLTADIQKKIDNKRC